jgi:transcriptional regulator with XRE-family HTH domain
MLGDLMRQRRERLGLPVREAARRIGISTGYLVELEHGRNPTTGRAPVPSPTVLAGIGRTFDVDIATLLDLTGAAPRRSAHVLLVQDGTGRRSVRAAAARAVGAPVDAWIEIAGQGRPGTALRAVADAVPAVSAAGRERRFGLIFGARSAALRAGEDPGPILAAERTWEDDVAAVCKEAAGAAPAANVCVYRRADLDAVRGDPLTVALELIAAHPHVAMQDRRGAVTTGPAAIEAILVALRPADVAPEAWASLAAAAALGLHRTTARA